MLIFLHKPGEITKYFEQDQATEYIKLNFYI